MSYNKDSDHVYSGMLVPVRTSFNLRRRKKKRIMYQLKVDVDKFIMP